MSISLAALAVFSACGQSLERVPLPSSDAPLRVAFPQVAPPACKGQKITKEYAYLVETLSSRGGDLCIPVFGGFGGAAPYGPAHPSVKVTLTTSTTNYNHKLPQLGKSAPLWYGQFAFGGATTLGKKATGEITFTGAKIVSGKPYSLFGQVVIKGSKEDEKPCYAVASKGKYGGVFDAGKPFGDMSIQSDTTLIAELESGKQSGTKC